MLQESETLTFLNTNYVITPDWFELFTHFIQLDNHKKMPTKAWYTETKLFIDKIGEKDFMLIAEQWVFNCVQKSKANQIRFDRLGIVAAGEIIERNLGHKSAKMPEWVKKVYGEDMVYGGFFKMERYTHMSNFQNYFYRSLGGRILRGFLHAVIVYQDEKLMQLVDELAFEAPNTSQDVIHIYSKFPPEIAIPKLSILKARAKNRNILKRIDKAIAQIGKKQDKTKSQIEESVIPTLGINTNGEYIKQIAEVNCMYVSHNIRESQTIYQFNTGKTQKSLPKILKDNFPDELKGFKNKIKEIKTTLRAQRKRLEEFYLISHSTPYSSFIEYYFI